MTEKLPHQKGLSGDARNSYNESVTSAVTETECCLGGEYQERTQLDCDAVQLGRCMSTFRTNTCDGTC